MQAPDWLSFPYTQHQLTSRHAPIDNPVHLSKSAARRKTSPRPSTRSQDQADPEVGGIFRVSVSLKCSGCPRNTRKARKRKRHRYKISQENRKAGKNVANAKPM